MITIEDKMEHDDFLTNERCKYDPDIEAYRTAMDPEVMRKLKERIDKIFEDEWRKNWSCGEDSKK